MKSDQCLRLFSSRRQPPLLVYILFFFRNSQDFPETEELYKEDGGKWTEDRDIKEDDENWYDYWGPDDDPLGPLGADYLEEDDWDWDQGN